MPRLNHDRPGMTYSCPACDKPTIYERTGNGNTSNHPERPYSCENCGVALKYVIERPKKGHYGKERQTYLPGMRQRRDETARELSAKGPEDVGLSPIGARPGGAD